MTAEQTPILIDSREVCHLLGIGQTLFFSLRSAGKFPILPIRLGRAVRYSRLSVEKWIADGCPARWGVQR